MNEWLIIVCVCVRLGKEGKNAVGQVLVCVCVCKGRVTAKKSLTGNGNRTREGEGIDKTTDKQCVSRGVNLQ